MAQLNFAPAEFPWSLERDHETRLEKLLEHIRAENLGGVVLFDNYYILYFTGFAFIPTERPIAFVMNAQGEKAMFVPRLELEHAKVKTGFAQVDSYVEYPFEPHPMQSMLTLLTEFGVRGRVGADQDGYPWIFGYRGPTLSELAGDRVVRVAGFIEDMMMVKSDAEIALIRESVTWGNLAHRLLQRYTCVSATETEVSLRASQEATLAMLDTLGPLYQSLSLFGDGASAGYRGQIGRNAAIPHALANNISFMEGDVLVTGAGCPMWGYNSELERTMIVGQASDRQKRLFDAMLGAQQSALDALKPGARCADVDRAVRKYFEDNDLMPYWKHHSGHAIGLRYHEGPFLDVGDQTELQPGLVFTVEPGLYAADIGGFRHSDTVLVTKEGIEILTYYPRDLDSLTIPS
jgi:Xaa-Pro aminopeptidase